MKSNFNTKSNRLGGLIAALGLSLCLALPALGEGPSVVGGGGGGGARGGDGGGSSRGSSSGSSVRSESRSGTSRSTERSPQQHQSAAERSIQRHTDERNTADRYPNEQYRGQYSRPDARGRDAWPRGGMLSHPYMNQWHDSDNDRGNDVRRHDRDHDFDRDRYDNDYRYHNDYRGRYYYYYNDRYYDGYYPTFAPIVYYADDYVIEQPVASYNVVERPRAGDVTTDAQNNIADNSASDAKEEKGHYEEVPTREVIDGEFVEVNYPAVFRQQEDGKLVQVEEEKTVKEPKIRIILKRQWVGSGEEPAAKGDVGATVPSVSTDSVEIIKPDGSSTVKPLPRSTTD